MGKIQSLHSRGRAMVVEDDPTVRHSVAAALDQHGFEVIEAATGYDSMAILGTVDVEVLVCDIGIPGPDGIDVIRAAHDLSADVVSIVITGDTSLQSARRATQSGASDYLIKPFTAEQLTSAVQAAMSRKEHETLRARARELSDLFEFSRNLSAVNDPNQLLNVTTSTAVIQTQSDVACLATLHDGELTPVAISPQSERVYPDMYGEKGLLSRVAHAQTPILVTGLQGRHPLHNEIRVASPAQVGIGRSSGEALALPLLAGQKSHGAVAVVRFDDRPPYSKADYQLMSVLAAQSGLLLNNIGLIEDLEEAYMGTVQAMVKAIEARDEYTYGHSQRVGDIAVNIARHLEAGSHQLQTLELAAHLHDVGKIAVPDKVLRKPGKLTEEEWRTIRAHPVVGAEMVAPARFLKDTIPYVRHHHERYDGNGYPDGLAHDDLEELTEVIIAADAFDAMSSHRPYRPPLSLQQVLAEFDAGRNTQFAPRVVAAVFALHAQAA